MRLSWRGIVYRRGRWKRLVQQRGAHFHRWNLGIQTRNEVNAAVTSITYGRTLGCFRMLGDISGCFGILVTFRRMGQISRLWNKRGWRYLFHWRRFGMDGPCLEREADDVMEVRWRQEATFFFWWKMERRLAPLFSRIWSPAFLLQFPPFSGSNPDLIRIDIRLNLSPSLSLSLSPDEILRKDSGGLLNGLETNGVPRYCRLTILRMWRGCGPRRCHSRGNHQNKKKTPTPLTRFLIYYHHFVFRILIRFSFLLLSLLLLLSTAAFHLFRFSNSCSNCNAE